MASSPRLGATSRFIATSRRRPNANPTDPIATLGPSPVCSIQMAPDHSVSFSSVSFVVTAGQSSSAQPPPWRMESWDRRGCDSKQAIAKRQKRKVVRELAESGDPDAIAKLFAERVAAARRSHERHRKQLLLVASEQGREPTKAEVEQHHDQLLSEFADFSLLEPELPSLERLQMEELHVDKETHQLATQVYNRYPKSSELSWTVGELERFEHSTIEPTEPSLHASATDERGAPFAGRVGDGAPYPSVPFRAGGVALLGSLLALSEASRVLWIAIGYGDGRELFTLAIKHPRVVFIGIDRG